MITIQPVEGNRQKLDGGAMFGHVPRPMWSRWHPPDDLNRIELACRGFLVSGLPIFDKKSTASQTNRSKSNSLTLIDTGIGIHFSEKLLARYGVTPNSRDRLPESLAAHGVKTSQIDNVILSHLHFDHVGGAVSPEAKGNIQLTFKQARHFVSEKAWQRAQQPEPRDAASFQPDLLDKLQRSGKLTIVNTAQSFHLGRQNENVLLTALSRPQHELCYLQASGHSPGMLLPLLSGTDSSGTPMTAIYCADLIPGEAWLSTAIAMGYDRSPEQTCLEKRALYRILASQQQNNPKHAHYLLFGHDPNVGIARIQFEGAKPVIVDRPSSLSLLLMLLIYLSSFSLSSCTKPNNQNQGKSQAISEQLTSHVKDLVQHCTLSTWGAIRRHTCSGDTLAEKNIAQLMHKSPPETLLPEYCRLMKNASKIINDTPDSSHDQSQTENMDRQSGDHSNSMSSDKAAVKHRKNGLLSYLANQIVRLSFRIPNGKSVSPDTLSCMLSELKRRHNQSTDRSLSIAAVNITASSIANTQSGDIPAISPDKAQPSPLDNVLTILDNSDNASAKLAGYQALWAKGRLSVLKKIKGAILGKNDPKLKDAVIYSLSMGMPWSKKEKAEVCALLASFLSASKTSQLDKDTSLGIPDSNIVVSAAARQIAAKCDKPLNVLLNIAKKNAKAGTIDSNFVFAVSGIAKRMINKSFQDSDISKTLKAGAVEVLNITSNNNSTQAQARILAFNQLSEIDPVTAANTATILVDSTNKAISTKAKSLVRVSQKSDTPKE